jgi:AcrR family transcriptional regulator
MSLRESHKDLTRRRIRAAARDLFIENGADFTTIDGIAARAGIGRATFYLHYQNKTEVLLDIIQQTETARREIFRQLLRMPKVTPAAIRAWMARFIEIVGEHKQSDLRLIEIGRGAHSGAENIVISSRAQIVEELGARYERFRIGGRPSAARERKRVEAMLMIAQIEQFCACVVHQPGSYDLDAGLDVLSRRLWEFCQDGAAVAPEADAASGA